MIDVLRLFQRSLMKFKQDPFEKVEQMITRSFLTDDVGDLFSNLSIWSSSNSASFSFKFSQLNHVSISILIKLGLTISLSNMKKIGSKH